MPNVTSDTYLDFGVEPHKDSFRNKHQDILVRKKFRKHPPYRCCSGPSGNTTKYSIFCCTYPMIHKRCDITLNNKQVARAMDDEVFIY